MLAQLFSNKWKPSQGRAIFGHGGHVNMLFNPHTAGGGELGDYCIEKRQPETPRDSQPPGRV